MAKTFKILSALLSYPTQEVQEAAPLLRRELRQEGLLSSGAESKIVELVDAFEAADLYDLQERYVDLFDRGRSLSLYLFEHVHGESRDRGQAMIDLKSLYERRGLAIDSRELPDYLPLFLEFLSMLPLDEARRLLGQTAHILEALAERLEKRKSPYAQALRAALELAAHAEVLPQNVIVPEPAEADSHDLAVLDAEWEEAAVTFGPEAGPSCKDGLVARIRAARRPAPGVGDARRAS
jgi:nitrate reductase delta subunit